MNRTLLSRATIGAVLVLYSTAASTQAQIPPVADDVDLGDWYHHLIVQHTFVATYAVRLLAEAIGAMRSPNQNCGGGVYGATGTGAPYVTGAVVHGSQTGAGGGQAAATGVGLNQLQQQPQPVLVSVKLTTANRIEILFIPRVSLPETSV